MTLPNLQALTAPFAEEELQHFAGRGGKQMTYIEDETVMDRLDAAFGMGNWQVHTDPIPVYDGVVKVRLGVRIDSEWIWHEDYGYPNRKDGEALKEAVSDGIRRCGRFLGIGRDLYRRDDSTGTIAAPQPRQNGHSGQVRSAAPVRPAPPPRSTTDVPEFPDDFGPEFGGGAPTPIRPSNGGGGAWTFGKLAKEAEERGIPKTAIYSTADKLFGPKTKVTDLEPGQREQIAFEMGFMS